MKLKVSKKELLKRGNVVLHCGNGELQNLLSYTNPFAYSARLEGWACDYYEIDDVIISTGYSPIGKKVNYDIMKKYEEKARNINKKSITFEESRKEIGKLALEFIKEVK